VRGATLLAACLISGAAWSYEPQMNYILQCMGCHTPDGSGVPDRVPSIRQTLVPFASRADGRKFLVQVPGSAQSRLNDTELAELLNWMIRSLSEHEVPPDFKPFSADEVARYRSQPLTQVRAERDRLMNTRTKE
jgi:hypothetical protein